MVTYEIHWRDEMGMDHLIGILPERRKKAERITQGSVLEWARTFLDDISDFSLNNTYFIQKELKGEIPF
jgi:hypothetical protein